MLSVKLEIKAVRIGHVEELTESVATLSSPQIKSPEVQQVWLTLPKIKQVSDQAMNSWSMARGQEKGRLGPRAGPFLGHEPWTMKHS